MAGYFSADSGVVAVAVHGAARPYRMLYAERLDDLGVADLVQVAEGVGGKREPLELGRLADVYTPAGKFRRTAAERADPGLAWRRDDQAFFAAGACHVLAWEFVAAHPEYRVVALRKIGDEYPSHVIASDGTWAFDHDGWTLESDLLAATAEFEGVEAWDAAVVTDDLQTFCATRAHRPPQLFPHDPRPRARQYLARFPSLPPDPTAVLRGVEGVLLDFDGPVADLFPSGNTSRIAEEVRGPILAAGIEMPEMVGSTRNHLVVLEFAAAGVLEAAETKAVEGEVEAAAEAPITAGAAEFLAACGETGIPVAIVSNNARAAVEIFLTRFGVAEQVAGICGRPFARPELMKPDPALVEQALKALGLDAGNCVMIGDSVTDIEVSRRAGVRSIGYAKNPRRGEELRQAGADATTESMGALANIVRALHA